MKQENGKLPGLREELKGLSFLVEGGTYGWKCEWNAHEYVFHHQEEWNNLLSLYYGFIGKAIMGKSQCWMRLGFSILGIVRLWRKLPGPCVAPPSSKVYKKRLEKCICQWWHTWSSSWLGKKGWLDSLFAVSSRSAFLQFFKILIHTWIKVFTRNLKISSSGSPRCWLQHNLIVGTEQIAITPFFSSLPSCSPHQA